VTGSDGTRVDVTVPILNPAAPRPDQLRGFVETDGYVSIEAEHFQRAVAPEGREWKVIPNHGRTLSGVTPWPVTLTATLDATGGMRLEYDLYLFSRGTFGVDAHLAPTQKFQPGDGVRFAVSLDAETPQVVNIHADGSLAAWEREVADGAKVVTSRHVVGEPGRHVLKLWALDPGLVLQKLVVHTTALRPSYLGPPESHRGGQTSPERRSARMSMPQVQ
jgi:hypothetical protein